ncbi:hypothetical protein ABT381_31155, partial [Streptomyces sp. NPDC000151]
GNVPGWAHGQGAGQPAGPGQDGFAPGERGGVPEGIPVPQGMPVTRRRRRALADLLVQGEELPARTEGGPAAGAPSEETAGARRGAE